MTLQDAFNTAAEDPYEEQLIWRTDTGVSSYIYLRLIDPVTAAMHERHVSRRAARSDTLVDSVLADAMEDLRGSVNVQTQSSYSNWQVGSRQQLKQRLMRLGELQ